MAALDHAASVHGSFLQDHACRGIRIETSTQLDYSQDSAEFERNLDAIAGHGCWVPDAGARASFWGGPSC
jgi:hypothetical protein